MEPNEAVELYRRAEQLFQEGQYSASLSIIERLDAAFPKTKHFMFSRAKCLQKLNRVYEAAVLCDVITAQFQDPRAAELKRSLLALMTTGKGIDTGSRMPSSAPRRAGSPLVVGAVVAVCLLVALCIA
ncbi:MAG: tetratricopeptide repeat protein, partial [Candidatus Hydrogenedentes bacterium]|nr:tetratricopeptide repeat protein [Candidatus Hydrogenedentota bacterium]